MSRPAAPGEADQERLWAAVLGALPSPEDGPGLLRRTLEELRRAGVPIVVGAGGARLDLAAAYPDPRQVAARRALLMPFLEPIRHALAAVAPAGARPASAPRPASGERPAGGAHAPPVPPAAPPGPARVVRPEPPPTVRLTTTHGLAEAVARARMMGVVGLDTETTGLDPHRSRLRLVQFGTADTAYIADAFAPGMDLAPVAALVSDPAVIKVAQNARFDLGFLRSVGIFDSASVVDPMLASQLVAAGQQGVGHSLKALARRHLGVDLDKREQAGDWSGELTGDQMAYAALDVALLPELWRVLGSLLRRDGMEDVAGIEMAALPAVTDLEFAGMPIDRAALEQLAEATARQRDAYAEDTLSVLPPLDDGQARLVPVPVRLNAPAEVLRALRALGVEIADGRDESLAARVDHPAVAAYLGWRKAERRLVFLSGMAEAVHPVTGRLHPSYRQIGASSGRMSCSGPSLQQVPRDASVRRLFTPAEGRTLVVADYSQVELRIAAAMAGEERMLEAFARGEDLHRRTAALVSGKDPADVTAKDRQLAKAANFGLVYAMGARGLEHLARTAYGVALSPEEAVSLRERFFGAYPGLVAWHRRVLEEAQRDRQLRTAAGRLIRFEGEVHAAEAYNLPVQGTGADILKAAIGRLWGVLAEADANLVGAVHDELLVECPAEVAEDVRDLLASEMRGAAEDLVTGVPFPVEAHVAASWADK